MKGKNVSWVFLISICKYLFPTGYDVENFILPNSFGTNLKPSVWLNNQYNFNHIWSLNVSILGIFIFTHIFGSAADSPSPIKATEAWSVRTGSRWKAVIKFTVLAVCYRNAATLSLKAPYRPNLNLPGCRGARQNHRAVDSMSPSFKKKERASARHDLLTARQRILINRLWTDRQRGHGRPSGVMHFHCLDA